MDPKAFEVLRVSHEGAIYAGKWSASIYSVAVRYGNREVSVSASGPNKLSVAKSLLLEMIDDDRERHRMLDRVEASAGVGPEHSSR
jgi:hypothetical protein